MVVFRFGLLPGTSRTNNNLKHRAASRRDTRQIAFNLPSDSSTFAPGATRMPLPIVAETDEESFLRVLVLPCIISFDNSQLLLGGVLANELQSVIN
jgi:hypothetical protein